MDIYFQFLEHVRSKNLTDLLGTEYHHEPPHHTGQSSEDSPLNVRATLKDHILLHQYRWIAYGEKGDYLMFKGRQGDTEEFRQAMNEHRIEVMRNRGSGFCDPYLQSILGKRGGVKGGSANTPDQFLSRQKVGRENGRKNGKSRQSSQLEKSLSRPVILEHKSGITLEVLVECASDLREILESYGFALPKGCPSGMLVGGKPWGGWVVQGRSFDKRSETRPTRWASDKGNLVKYGFVVGGTTVFPEDKEYRLCLSETFMDYCKLHGKPQKSK